MFAIGRRPNVMGLGIEKLGSRFTSTVASKSTHIRRPSVPNIYAVGDVTNRVNLTPVAIREGHAFADTVFGGKPTRVDHANVPTAVFSEPEIGVDRTDRSPGARPSSTKRGRVQDQLPADEGDAVRPRRRGCS